MKRTFKNENGHLIAEVSFDGEEIKSAQERAINKLIQNVTVPGFRKGKAPKERAISRLSQQQVFDESINAMLRTLDKNFNTDEEFQSYVKGNKLLGRFRPDVELKKYEAEDAEFVVTWILVPEVKTLGEYKGLKSDVKLKRVLVADIDTEIKKLAEENAELVEADKAAEIGDTANIDFVGLMNGEAFEGGSSKGFDLELGSKRFVPGFEEQIVSHKAGDKFDVALTMPENYPAPLTGKAVVFKVTLNSVKVKEVPEINDEFATTLSGKYVSKDLAELKAKVKENLSKQNEENFKNSKINGLLLQIRENSEFVIAKEYIDQLVKDRKASDEDAISKQGLSLEEYLKLTNNTMEAYEKQLTAGVEAELKTQLVYEALAKALEIPAPTQKDIEDQLGTPLNQFINSYTNYLKGAKLPEEQINAQINGYINQVFASILTNRVQSKVLELNTVAKKTTKKAEEKPAEEKVEEKPAEEAKAE